jgi:hypothetical protein
MKFGSVPIVGRYIVDIDGCLRSTDTATLTRADILALRGMNGAAALVVWHVYDDAVVLGETDVVRLDEQTVAYFATLEIGAMSSRGAPGRCPALGEPGMSLAA